ncbi:Stk1 family PASTA domain-containing Ser/Thr kinase [Macrococcus hajekii]|uniref:Serine/threonine-protein kinase PrkC n=1 Tax=Macrococcus hajekii TaxID=198482 RepID=A0A4R6BN20_9STAP|nr:Stk1 family PASTA domain-containing Ser/Thr kinase [Macrococcus hajekii]TDM03240.1 Stk1 family PASTA domain-containing Ser/Thr kinase [Macrococcus hajekii]GGA97227.1 protein kinase [Macrococcus hajekii]
MLGQTIGKRYKLISLIGGGGMSQVYLADDLILNQQVAVKVITIPAHDRERTIQRFEREVENATTLSHPNIVKVIDVDEDDHHYYLVMEYIDGPTLSDYIHQQGKLTVEEAILFTKQILRGIGHAHQHMIIHRDIKPQNILLTKDHVLKVTDFGIARALSETAMTQTNHIMGSVHYLSPEQAKGKDIDESSDIYAIGVVLYEMLTGRPPFEGESAVSIAIKQIQEPLPAVNDVPQSIENVIIKATLKEKYRRYRTTEAMYEDISTALDETRRKEQRFKVVDDETRMIPVVKTVPKQPEEKEEKAQPKVTHEPRKRNRFLMLLLPLLALLLFMGATLAYMMSPKMSFIPDVTGKTMAEATALLADEHLSKGTVSKQFSNQYDEGRIISTSPSGGEKVKELTKINLIVSKGKETYKIKDYQGQDIETVKESLYKAGFSKVKVKEEASEQTGGTILSQDMEAGKEVEPGQTTIEFTVSKGLDDFYIGDYRGQSYQAIKKQLQDQGMNVRMNNSVYDARVAAGHIVNQSAVYMMMPIGSTVTFDVSKGPEATTEKPTTEKPTTESTSEKPTTEKPTTETPETAAPDLTKTYTSTVLVPYGGTYADTAKTGKQNIEVFVGDQNNQISKVYQSLTTEGDETITIPMSIAEGKEGSYIIKVDGKVFQQETIDYNDI